MSKGKVNPSASIESVEESGGELTATITPQMAIQCARASLLLSSLRPPTLRQTDLDAQVIHASVDLLAVIYCCDYCILQVTYTFSLLKF